jgi:menaquinone-dependent protoporphyrinogen oxidase
MELTLVYWTHFGQAKKIMHVLAEQWTAAGLVCHICSLEDVQREPRRLTEAQAVVVGAPIYFGAFDKAFTAFVNQHHELLNRIPSAFFVVCFAAGSPQATDQVEVIKLSRQFLRQTGWDPPLTQGFAGALRYSQYGWFKKRFVHWIAQRAGVPSDIQHDLEMTDWAEVRTFGQRFVDHLQGQPVENAKWL